MNFTTYIICNLLIQPLMLKGKTHRGRRGRQAGTALPRENQQIFTWKEGT